MSSDSSQRVKGLLQQQRERRPPELSRMAEGSAAEDIPTGRLTLSPACSSGRWEGPGGGGPCADPWPLSGAGWRDAAWRLFPKAAHLVLCQCSHLAKCGSL